MKKLVTIVLIAAMLISLVGCNGDNTTTSEVNSGITSSDESIGENDGENEGENEGEISDGSDIYGETSNSNTPNTSEKSETETEGNTGVTNNSDKLDSNWEYTLDDSSITLTKYKGEQSKITVPSKITIEDKEYNTVIAKSTESEGVFTGNKTITSVKFEAGIQLPEDKSNMFNGCNNLFYVDSESLFETKTSNVTATFKGCSRLNTIDISNTDISQIPNNQLFDNCDSLALIVASNNSSIKAIENNSSVEKSTVISEKLDKSQWEYNYETDTKKLRLLKYKGNGKAEISPAYSLGGTLYKNIVYGEKEDPKASSNKKPSTTTTKKPSTSSSSSNSSNSKPNNSSSSNSKPNNSSSSSSSSKPNNSSSNNNTSKPSTPEKVYYTVEFNTGDGTKVSSQKVLKGETLKDIKEPTNEYYKFYGWYTSRTYKTRFYSDDPVTSNMTLYARWEDASSVYGVEHYKENGDRKTYELADSETLYSVKNTTVEAVPKEFSGYSENRYHTNSRYTAKLNGYSDVVLRIYYDKDTFTAKFNSNGGNSINQQTVDRYSNYREIEPRKTDHTFEGWYTDAEFTRRYNFDSEVKDITLYAKWRAHKSNYTVEHYREDSSGNYKLADTDKLVGNTDSVVTSTYKEYEGYSVNTSHPDRVDSITLDSNKANTLKVYYKLKEHNVKFITNTESGEITSTVKHGGKVTQIETPVNEGYKFIGWYTDVELNNKFNFSTRIEKDTSVYAKWEAIEVVD